MLNHVFLRSYFKLENWGLLRAVNTKKLSRNLSQSRAVADFPSRNCSVNDIVEISFTKIHLWLNLCGFPSPRCIMWLKLWEYPSRIWAVAENPSRLENLGLLGRSLWGVGCVREVDSRGMDEPQSSTKLRNFKIKTTMVELTVFATLLVVIIL